MASVVSRRFDATPAEVWRILADGWLYGLWVVGASRIRDVSESWPETGACIHHSVGSWPLVLDDTTHVVESEPAASMVLQARAWPSGEASVRMTLTPDEQGTVVTMEEDAAHGPALLIPGPVRRAALEWRNRESLRRLSYLVEHRVPPGPGSEIHVA
jgi:uncharacterized protein YndB with AHSA1/START domain